MKKLVVGLISLVLLCDKVHAQPYNYAEALQKSLLFYDTQRSGAVAATSRVNWRGNSHMRDGAHVLGRAGDGGAWDLSGGWYDGGGHVKWNNAMSFAMSTLAWGAVEYKAGYISSGQMPFLLDQLRWCGDYFVKCVKFTNPNEIGTYRIAIDVGDQDTTTNPLNPFGFVETNFEAPREVIHRFFPRRPVYYADVQRPQNGSVAAMAAGLASAAYVLRDNGDTAKSNQYLALAVKLYEFAKAYPMTDANRNEIKNQIRSNVPITGPALPRDNDPRAWAAIWLHKAQIFKNPNFGFQYLTDARNLVMSPPPFTMSNSTWNAIYSISDYKLATQILLTKYYSTGFYQLYDDRPGHPGVPLINNRIEDCLDVSSDSLPPLINDHASRGYSPGGLARIQDLYSRDRSFEGFGKPRFGSLIHALNQAFCASVYADYVATMHPVSGYGNPSKSAKYRRFAKRQLDYALGTNPHNRSYVHGYQPAGKSVLTIAPHSTAKGTWAGSEHYIVGRPEYEPNYRHIPFGAVAGGPDWNDKYAPLDGTTSPAFPLGMTTAHQTKVGLENNACFSGLLARMVSLGSAGSVLPNFPDNTKPTGAINEEYFVEAEQTTTTNSIQIRARMNNRSRWPATVRNRMSFKYFYVAEPNAVITPSIVAFAGTAPLEAASNAQISAPVNYEGNKFYVTVSFSGDTIFPGYAPPAARMYYKEVIFKLTSSTTWDNSNDFSFAGFAPLANVVPPNIASKIAVYDNGMLIGGQQESPLSVSAKSTKVKFSLSPNPAKNDLNLSWDLISNQSKQVDIYDMLGKKVSSFKNVTGSGFTMQVGSLKSGIYIVDVRLSNNQESLGKIKFVKE